MRRLIYVAGYGRSGSTVLDVLLGAHPDVCSVGEVAFLPEESRMSGRVCACGDRFGACDFWSGFEPSRAGDGDPREGLDRVESRAALRRLLDDRLPRAHAEAYREYHRRLLAYVRGRSGCPVVVDSSKSAGRTAGRALALARLVGEDVYLLHLVRGGAETIWSVVRHGSNWAREGRAAAPSLPALRTALGWTLAHRDVLRIGRRFPPDRRLRIRYGDLVSRPETTLGRIGEWVGLDLSGVAERAAAGKAFPVGHNVGGNRIRHRDAIRLRERGEVEPARPPPLWVRGLFAVVGGWMERKLDRGQW